MLASGCSRSSKTVRPLFNDSTLRQVSSRAELACDLKAARPNLEALVTVAFEHIAVELLDEQRRARADQKAEVVLGPGPLEIEHRILAPSNEDVPDEHDPGGETIPQTPPQLDKVHTQLQIKNTPEMTRGAHPDRSELRAAREERMRWSSLLKR